jgi:choloylglycine hydrolase
MKHLLLTIVAILFGILMNPSKSTACSVLYYKDIATGKIYVVNSEDFFLDVDAYIQIEPKSKKNFARLWYGWDKFAQGGINEKGLFFDAAVTPEQEKIKGYANPKRNLGDKILAQSSSVKEALEVLEKEKIALNKSHMLFGDKTGQAVVVEWVNGERKLHWIVGNKLIMTNFLLSEPKAGNYPCYRYKSISDRINQLETGGEIINLLKIGNTFGQAVQPARKHENNRFGGTVYTSFIDVTENKFFLSYKLSNKNMIKFDLTEEFAKSKRQKINLKEIEPNLD